MHLHQLRIGDDIGAGQKHQVPASGHDAHVGRTRLATVRGGVQTHWHAPCLRIDDICGGMFRTIVHDDDFVGRQGLFDEAVQAGGERASIFIVG